MTCDLCCCDMPESELSIGQNSRICKDAEACAGRRPAVKAPGTTEPLLQFFAYAHLPKDKQSISKPFGELATWIVATLPRNPERTLALRELLRAKDCAVRASIWKDA